MPQSLQDYLRTEADVYAWLFRESQKPWIVFCAKPSKHHWHNVHYLGRYIKRPPLAQSRLQHYDGNIVVFQYLNHKNQQQKSFTCSAKKFIARFIQHIPDKGFRLIRYYGFLANRVRSTLLPIVYQLLDQTVEKTFKLTWKALLKKETGFDPLECILCQSKMQLQLLCVGLSSKQLHHYHQPITQMKYIPA